MNGRAAPATLARFSCDNCDRTPPFQELPNVPVIPHDAGGTEATVDTPATPLVENIGVSHAMTSC